MASIFIHPAVAVSLLPWFRSVSGHKSVLLTGMVCTVLPDADVIGLRMGIAYGDLFGHRGISHSLFFALIIGALLGRYLARITHASFTMIWLYLSLCMASHGLLDAMTNGGLGIAFFSPFIETRYFLPFQPIQVSSLSITEFFQGQGIEVLKTELLWIGVPSLFVTVTGLVWQMQPSQSSS